MMKRTISFILAFVMCIAALPQIMLANGGPDETSDYIIGGNISFVDTPDILVEKEDLRITVSPRTSVVTAVYTLKNTGGAKTLGYTFPVSKYSLWGGGELEWIAFYDGDQKLSYNKLDKQTTSDSYKTESVGNMKIEYYDLTNYYYNTQLSFAPNETKILTITYKAWNSFDSWSTNWDLLSNYSDVSFLYDLRPAAYWGNGKAGEFNLTVDYSDLYYATDIKLNFDGFKREPDGVFQFIAKDFDFAKQGFISLVFDSRPFEIEQMEMRLLDNDYLEKVYVSSTLKSNTNAYSAKNLFDGDVDTAWVEGAKGYGIGDTIEFSLQIPLYYPDCPIGIGILNGYVKDEDVYYNNGRIKKLKVESGHTDDNGKINFEEHPLRGEQIIEFEDVPYGEIDFNCIMANIKPIVLTPGDYSVRLTILEVYPGQKYEDTCISEILPMGYYPDGYDKAGYELVTKPIK